ncbi:MAG: GGDEF domain-containing protein [Desulfobacterales bacterium]|nr:GGDEF domain-containing protein [Desulfobacterales bacterium]
MISFIKYQIGPEWALSAFYIFPIILVTWYAGIGAGIFISFTSAISWLFADLMMVNLFSNPIIPYLNETFRLIVFLIITFIIFKLKTSLENQKQLAGTDPLTSVANRRAFYDFGNMELNKARRYQTPISFLYLDIDNFKKINDHFGHHIGDKLLRSVAETIKNSIRAIDLIVRFGGDEFGILLAETGAESAAQVVGKLKKKLIELVQDNGWPVTFSIGVATFINPPDRIDEMIDAADAQMYFAKQNGNNRTRYKVFVEDDKIISPLKMA